MTVDQVLQEIIDNDLLDDRREYTAADLWYAYELGPFEAEELFNKIQALCR